jgi:hypothetical protein
MTWNPSGTNAVASLFSLTGTGGPGGPITIPANNGTVSTGLIQAGGLYSAYDLTVNVHTTSQSTTTAALTAQAFIQWYVDAAGQIPIGPPDCWQFWSGNAANSVPNCFVSGQVRGNYFNVTFQGLGATTQTVDTLNIYGSNRYQSGLSMTQDAPSSSEITTNSGVSMLSLVAGTYQPTHAANLELYNQWPVTVPASTTNWQPLPLYAGPVYSRIEIGTVWNNDMYLASAENLTSGGIVAGTSGKGILINYPNVAQQEVEGTATNNGPPVATGGLVILPQVPCYFVVATTTNSVTYSYHLTCQRYAGS